VQAEQAPPEPAERDAGRLDSTPSKVFFMVGTPLCWLGVLGAANVSSAAHAFATGEGPLGLAAFAVGLMLALLFVVAGEWLAPRVRFDGERVATATLLAVGIVGVMPLGAAATFARLDAWNAEPTPVVEAPCTWTVAHQLGDDAGHVQRVTVDAHCQVEGALLEFDASIGRASQVEGTHIVLPLRRGRLSGWLFAQEDRPLN
jgi:hypothetical protein